MEYRILQNRTARFFAENQLLKFLFVILAASNVLFGFMAYRAHHNHTTILVPVGFREKIVMDGNRVSEAYLIQMARYAFDLALGYTPTKSGRSMSFCYRCSTQAPTGRQRSTTWTS